MAETVFAQVLRGEAPASFVYRDDLVSAFMDIQPVNPGHVLVVPNEPRPTSLTSMKKPAHRCSASRTGSRRRCGVAGSGVRA